MSEFIIIEIANEEAIKVFPELADSNPSYIWSLAKLVTNDVLYHYSPNSVESETEIRKLLFKHLKEFRKFTSLK